jgi:hypothetical protein
MPEICCAQADCNNHKLCSIKMPVIKSIQKKASNLLHIIRKYLNNILDVKIHAPCRNNKILLLSSLNVFISLTYPLKYETFLVLPLFCHCIISKQHFQFNGNAACRDMSTTRRCKHTMQPHCHNSKGYLSKGRAQNYLFI